MDREKEVRVAIEDSHLSLLSRVQDMENELQAGRLKVRWTKNVLKKYSVLFF